MSQPGGVTYEGSIYDPDPQDPKSLRYLGMAMGGLGTGTLEIDRAGRFAGIRVQNNWMDKHRPTPVGTFLSAHATDGERAVGRVLQLEPVADLPAIEGLTYTGRFPFTRIAYQDADLPCEVALEAFSPFVPQDAQASSVPIVFFTVRLTNPGPRPIRAAAALSWRNAINPTFMPTFLMQGNYNTAAEVAGLPAVRMSTHCPDLPGSEYLLACAPAEGVTYSAQPDWWQAEPTKHKGGEWIKAPKNEEALAHWRTFLDTGDLPAHRRPELDDGLGPYTYHQPVGAVAGAVDLAPGETREVRLALAWFFPHHRPRMYKRGGHWYAKRFPGGAREAAQWAIDRFGDLRARSASWRDLLDASTLPEKTRTMIGESAYLASRISWWLGDGRFMMHEATLPLMNPVLLQVYITPAFAALFPDQNARELRNTAEYQLASGEIPTFLGHNAADEPRYRVFSVNDVGVYPACACWEMLWGGGGEAFAADLYPVVKRVLRWGATLDEDGDGVPDTHGVNQGWDAWPQEGAVCYVADMWMAGLRAGAFLADRFADPQFAAWCRAAEERASGTVEERLWTGEYYRLSHDPATGRTSDVCFADMFCGQALIAPLGLGLLHPEERIRKSLEAIWRINVEPAPLPVRTGAHPDGTPDLTTINPKRGENTHANSFTPVVAAPLACMAMRFGMYDRALALLEDAYGFVMDRAQGPWDGQLFFNANTGEWFYGQHYSDCLIVWQVLHAATGVQVNALDRTLALAPPRVPVRAPVFSRLFHGQVAFAREASGLSLALTPTGPSAVRLRALRVQLPADAGVTRCVEVNGESREIAPDAQGGWTFPDVCLASEAAWQAVWR